jgi:tetratricopeptide (TPR) repeat protein
MRSDKIDRLERYLKDEEWEKARRIIKGMLAQSPQDHWLLASLAHTHYEQYEYARALAILQKARKIAPRCPLVLWYFAGALDMLGREKEAIAIWKGLLKRGLENIAFGECGEGLRRAELYLNDARYRIGCSYADLGMKALAARYLNDHLKHRRRGLRSEYSLRQVRRKLRTLQLADTGSRNSKQ